MSFLQDTEKSHVLGAKDQEILNKRTDKLAFYTRNNPHPGNLFSSDNLSQVFK